MVDVHAHFLDESGFIILINPSEETTLVDLPLNEPASGSHYRANTDSQTGAA